MHANSDREINRLLDWLESRERRSVVLVYGDHLPGFQSLFDELGFADGRDPGSQPTPWLMFDSMRTESASPSVHIAAWMLPSLLLRQAGLDDDRYFPVIGELGARLVSGHADAVRELATAEVQQVLEEIGLARISGQFDKLTAVSDDNADGP